MQPERNSNRLYDDIFLPEEAVALRLEARRFCDETLRPVARQLNGQTETADAFPWEVHRALARAGFLGVAMPKELGGRGLEFPTLGTAAVVEELAYYSNGLASVFQDEALLVCRTLAAAPKALRRELVQAVISGERVGVFATSEPGASSDLSPAALQTVAAEVAGGFRVTGRKRFITNAVVADFGLVLCRTGERSSLLLCDLRAPGVKIGAPDKKLGNRAQLTSDIVFDGLFVRCDHAIGGVGGGLKAALSALACGRICVGAAAVGMAQAAFDYALARLRERKAFGKRLGEYQHWQFRMVQRATEIENARNLYVKAALCMDRGRACAQPEVAKVYATRMCVDMVRDAIQIHGALGWMKELAADGTTLPLEAMYRDAKIGEIYEGANEVLEWVAARSILGRDLTG